MEEKRYQCPFSRSLKMKRGIKGVVSSNKPDLHSYNKMGLNKGTEGSGGHAELINGLSVPLQERRAIYMVLLGLVVSIFFRGFVDQIGLNGIEPKTSQPRKKHS